MNAEKILVVDDDKALRDLYKIRLNEAFFQVVEAADGEEGLVRAMDEKPDLIVLDLMMPKINGMDVLDILKATKETKDIPVIVVTALVHDDVRKRVIDSGALAYLTKFEYRPAKVVEVVKLILKDRRGA